jgi:hypothetical protein
MVSKSENIYFHMLQLVYRYAAVSLHARHAISRGWRPAELLPADDAMTPWTAHNLVPFWMDSHNAVSNDLSLDGLVLLTGPNMVGLYMLNSVYAILECAWLQPLNLECDRALS